MGIAVGRPRVLLVRVGVCVCVSCPVLSVRSSVELPSSSAVCFSPSVSRPVGRTGHAFPSPGGDAPHGKNNHCRFLGLPPSHQRALRARDALRVAASYHRCPAFAMGGSPIPLSGGGGPFLPVGRVREIIAWSGDSVNGVQVLYDVDGDIVRGPKRMGEHGLYRQSKLRLDVEGGEVRQGVAGARFCCRVKRVGLFGIVSRTVGSSGVGS